MTRRFKQEVVEEGEVYDVIILSTGSKGDGVAKIGGKIVFVHNAEVGKSYKIRVYKNGESVAFADII
jgi:translation initiation factor 2 subunit 2